MPRGKGRKRFASKQGGIDATCRRDSSQSQSTSRAVVPQPLAPSLQDGSSNQPLAHSYQDGSSNQPLAPSSHESGAKQHAPTSQDRETTNQVLREDELYLKTHRTKDDKWICVKSERVWNTFTRNIKQKVGEKSTTRNEDSFKVQERDVRLNRATKENEAQECNDDNNILTLLQTIPKEQVLNTWIDTIGGAKKGRVYGLGSMTQF
ncbi:uncharacterized protein LOC110659780 [Hevea brasiliensis]|uniref:uncharacterized protein LOC110659780 n=1 Tax=Hevea brasiliensis TaxID=3981 RepID=UPI0025E23845|nr:uncharacterized protein LOC110659780 [Hevea brasiliensis]XP_057993991.1 uncharacterized protein LOC110659780 [Hevea brasiliensis]XP_057993992.1 uncharacterized protein LOC110659780 [Hevea brasiliensis]XP_057993993.1 uncharacterized protein LOC110659780 [Hevea brasiliensis]XP_057993994.1 uncharacterized protein LOC110659780 [Hevea brasiliensis]XP_057993995.1 uncharacterized protein LOC110659780 [Hevea brasiliensis]XP_057993996.1 uncharacterized protein LOC110659780 [Hevea brasiliensis]